MVRFSSVLLLFLFIIPIFGFAASRVWPTGYWGPLLSCVGSASSTVGTTEGPRSVCASLCDTFATAQNVVDFGMSLVIFAIAPVLILWGGIAVITAGGSPERVSYGKGVLTKTVLGLVVVLGAYVIVATFLWAVGANLTQTGEPYKVSWPNIECRV